jgi:hypothetical protein
MNTALRRSTPLEFPNRNQATTMVEAVLIVHVQQTCRATTAWSKANYVTIIDYEMILPIHLAWVVNGNRIA